MNNDKHYHVVFATPGPNMHREYVKSLVATCSWLSERGKSFTLLNRNASFVSNAREWTAVGGEGSEWGIQEIGMGNFTYDRLVWIDSDISWEVSAFEKLISNDLDIVSGVMPVNLDGRIGATRFNEDGIPNVMDWKSLMFEDEVTEVDGVSFGFLAVKSGVFENMKRPWFRLREVPVLGHEGLLTTLGEDYSWCLGAKEAGYRIWIDQRVRVSHHKEYALEV